MSIQVAIAPGDRVVPWINQCPPEWPLKPLKYAAKINSRTLGENTASDFEINYIDISSVNSNGQQNPAETMAFGDAPSRARRIVSSGDVIVSTVRTYLKAISYIENANDNLICSTGFAVITPSPQVHPKFLFYWVRSEWFIDEIVARSVGVSYPAINAIEIGSLPFPAIPLEEQQAIADFLDREIARIDEMIAKKNRLIELLHEQRTSLITCTVTKGLNSDAPMKDSGVEWLENIPTHWMVYPIKRLEANAAYIAQTGPFGAQLHASDYTDEGVPLILIKHVYDWQIHEDSMPYIDPEKAEQLAMYRLEPNDIVFSRVGSVGRIALVSEKERGWLISGQMLRLRLRSKKIVPEFLIYFISSKAITRYLELTSLGSTRDSINTTILREMPIAVPPHSEQLSIIKYLNRETARIDNLVNRISQAIEKLREYRSAIITAAVTGKINLHGEIVRHE